MLSRGIFNFFAEPLESSQAKAEGQGGADEGHQGGGKKNNKKFHRMAKVKGNLQHNETKGHDQQGNKEEGKIQSFNHPFSPCAVPIHPGQIPSLRQLLAGSDIDANQFSLYPIM
jgi:hypothetical protein